METRATNVVFVVANMLMSIIWYYAACHILKPRFSRKQTVFVAVIAYVAFVWGTYWIEEDYSAVRTLINYVYNMLLFLFLYRGKWYKKILVLVLFIGILMVVEIMFLSLLKTDKGILDIETPKLIVFYGFYLFFNVLSIAAAIKMVRDVKMAEYSELTFKEITLFSLYPFSMVILFGGMCFIMGRDTGFPGFSFLLSVTLAAIISIVALIVVIQRVVAFSGMQGKRTVMKQKLDAQTAYYHELVEHYEALRRLRHDLANHVLALEILISEEKMQEASDYLEDMEREYGTAEVSEVKDL